jgi:hypothetical protein
MMLVFHIILRNSKAKKFNDKGVKNMLPCWGPVAHIYNPSYSGGRDQEDHSSKPVQANSLRDLILKKTITKKKAGEVAQGIGPEFKQPQSPVLKKKKDRTQKRNNQ